MCDKLQNANIYEFFTDQLSGSPKYDEVERGLNH